MSLCYKCRQDAVEGPRGGKYPSPGIRLCPLHAAAPMLLEALKEIADPFLMPLASRALATKRRLIAQAAIRAAKGESNV